MTVLNGSEEQEDVRSKCNCHLFATQVIDNLIIMENDTA